MHRNLSILEHNAKRNALLELQRTMEPISRIVLYNGKGGFCMKRMKRVFTLILIAAMIMILCSCGTHKADCEVVSEEFVDFINVNQISQRWEGYRIVKIVLNVSFAEKFVSEGAKQGEDAYLQQISQKIVDACSFKADGADVDITYYYWAKQASGYSAKELTLFYVIPETLELSDTEFSLDGAALGDPSFQFTYRVKNG